mmetsp:Transcript_91664/g.280494  ORF Transcript_91664/g.280494 Transcript_91664/m.280494 type:complete len:355 (-) Transcript_91664:401-1465(-)
MTTADAAVKLRPVPPHFVDARNSDGPPSPWKAATAPARSAMAVLPSRRQKATPRADNAASTTSKNCVNCEKTRVLQPLATCSSCTRMSSLIFADWKSSSFATRKSMLKSYSTAAWCFSKSLQDSTSRSTLARGAFAKSGRTSMSASTNLRMTSGLSRLLPNNGCKETRRSWWNAWTNHALLWRRPGPLAAALAAVRLAATTSSYAARCAGSISRRVTTPRLAGSSVRTSALRRRRISGAATSWSSRIACVRCCSSSDAASSCSTSMSAATPLSPASAKPRSVASSESLFCTGVPVSSSRLRHRTFLDSSLWRADAAFLRQWASSHTMYSKPTLRKNVRRSSLQWTAPAVVTTKS